MASSSIFRLFYSQVSTSAAASTKPSKSSGRAKIEPLTSLRFVAAFIVVLGHYSTDYLCIRTFPDHVVFSQAVSFFFILSGFILAYVYPVLPDRRSVFSFLAKRVGRLWPLHIATFLLALKLIPREIWLIRTGAPEWVVTLANIFMVHSWVPYAQFFFSYNSPSWSISTECFFYLMFPLLLIGVRRSVWIPVMVSLAVLGALTFWCQSAGFPELDGVTLSLTGLLQMSPLARLLEFVTGMLCARLFQRLNDALSSRLGRAGGTVIETGALALAATLMLLSPWLASVCKPTLGAAVTFWLKETGFTIPGFALVITVFAMQKGLWSRLMSLAPFVLLGEISYASYLAHVPLLMYHRAQLPQTTSVLDLGMAIAILLIVSHLLFRLLEQPCRSAVARGLAATNGRSAREVLESLSPGRLSAWLRERLAALSPTLASPVFRYGALLTTAEMVALVVLVSWCHPAIKRIDLDEAMAVTRSGRCLVSNIMAGEILGLESVVLCGAPQPDCLKLVFRNRSSEELRIINFAFIDLMDGDGKRLYQQPVNLSSKRERVAAGELWVETVMLPSELLAKTRTIKLMINNVKIGFLKFSPADSTDMNGLRLSIPLDAGASKDL